MVATLYDASLDAFKPQTFNFGCWPSYNPNLGWNSPNCFETENLHVFTNRNYSDNLYYYPINNCSLNWFGFGYTVYNEPVNLEEELKRNKGKANYRIVSSEKTKGTEVSGFVCDEKGDPMKNVIVLIAGTQTGTMTDEKGHFVVKSGQSAIILLVGMINGQSQEIVLNHKGKVGLKIIMNASYSSVHFDSVSVTNESIQGVDAMEVASPMADFSVSRSSGVLKREKATAYKDGLVEQSESKPDLSFIQARTNLNETAFFYPQLQTDEHGDVLINFTIPEALTRWKMLGFAHTKDLSYGFTEKELVTQKDLMVTPNAPRFFRENDTMTFTSKITSLSDMDLAGSAQLMLFDALTMKPIDNQMHNLKAQQTFSVKKGESTNLNWDIVIPAGLQAVTYRVVAQAGKFSDGEESSLPVLTNSMLVTETLPLPVKGRQTKTYTLDKLLHNTSATLRNNKLTLEFTSNPAWYAIQALPYLMEYPYECAEQTFSRFYANSIASHIANSNPRIKQVFDSWRNITPDALLSNLEKNQELKGLLLEETPWVLDAKNESERKRNVALLFDLNRMSNELDRALDKLQKLQVSNGGWPWFEGMPDNRYITQHIVCGMGKLDHLGITDIRTDNKTWSMVTRALAYIDDRIAEDYKELVKLDKAGKLKLSDNHLDYTQIHYLYTRSFFMDVPMNGEAKEALQYYIGQARKYWLTNNIYMQG
ncbi:MAG TPA: alpha-2-macroglobulin family protein, partial [Bacteroidales bacterium]